MNLYALKRVSAPDELAQAALNLASDASSFQSATAMLVDGGLSIYRSYGTLGISVRSRVQRSPERASLLLLLARFDHRHGSRGPKADVRLKTLSTQTSHLERRFLSTIG